MSRKIRIPAFYHSQSSMENPTTETTFETENLSEGNKSMREFISFFRDLIIILLLVLFVRSFFVTPFRINGSSMEGSYHDKEYIIVDKFSYLNLPVTYNNTASGNTWDTVTSFLLRNLPIHVGDPVRGDVVVITPHVDKQREYYIKRVIALPGDTIRFEDGNVFIKKSASSAFVEIKEPYLSLANA